VRGEKLRFVNDINHLHDNQAIGDFSEATIPKGVSQASARPETAVLPRSKSYANTRTIGTNEETYLTEDPQKNFQTRVNDLISLGKNPSNSKCLNSSVMEAWINETLKDAEHLEIPGIVIKPVHKTPLCRYRIDKLYLHDQGMNVGDIERIYRSFFVYSVGFYQMINKCVAHARNKYSILSSLWKVFQILLEYCCKSNYQMMVANISTEHKAEVDRLEEQFNRELMQY